MAKEFAWDSEVKIGMVEVSEKERRVINICELKGKKFVAVQKMIILKGEWKIIANATFPIDCFNEISNIVKEHTILQEVK